MTSAELFLISYFLSALVSISLNRIFAFFVTISYFYIQIAKLNNLLKSQTI